MIIPVLSAIAVLVHSAHAQVDCTAEQPCIDAAALQRFTAYPDPSIFAPVVLACGDSLADLTSLVVEGDCVEEMAVAPGCECSAACTTGVEAVTTQECKDAIITSICENAAVIEAEAAINTRSLFLHLLNDCSSLTEKTCDASVPDFDATVCEGLSSDFPLSAEGPDSTTRCKPGLFPEEAPAPPPIADAAEDTPVPEEAADTEATDRDADVATSASYVASVAVSASLVVLSTTLCVLL